VTRQTVIAYWLIPSEPAHSIFKRIINQLARRWNAPVFEPHVTIHVGEDRAGPPKNAVSAAVRECKRIALELRGIQHSDQFIKTLFVEFATSAELSKINDIIRQAANDCSRYDLKPHLSLLYKNLAVATRCDLAAAINIPLTRVTFDAVKAVRCVSPTETPADVDAWRVVAVASGSGDRSDTDTL
jgi:2'-5' RNA ligase